MFSDWLKDFLGMKPKLSTSEKTIQDTEDAQVNDNEENPSLPRYCRYCGSRLKIIQAISGNFIASYGACVSRHNKDYLLHDFILIKKEPVFSNFDPMTGERIT